MDPELRDLERAAAAAPDDAGLHVRLARAFERACDPSKAADALARVVEIAPSNADSLRDLDRLTRGGVDPRAPWPAERGDGWRTGRSRVSGPTKAAILERRNVLVDLQGIRGFAVDLDGRVVLGAGRRLDRKSDGLLEGKFEAQDRDRSIPASGKTPEAPSLFADGFVLGEQRVWTPHEALGSVVLVGEPMGARPGEVGTAPWAAGLGHVVANRGRQGLVAACIKTPLAIRWKAAIPRPPARLSFAPLARIVVLTEGGLGARGSLHTFDLASGKPLGNLTLDRVGIKAGVDLANVIASEDGWLYLGLGGNVAAISPDMKVAWRWEHPGEPAALAGEDSSIIVVCEPRSFTPTALDRTTGRVLWQSRDACLNGLPKVDARGWIYWRRESELVWLDPASGKTIGAALVGEHSWEFALAGQGRAYALRRAVRGSPAELVVVE